MSREKLFKTWLGGHLRGIPKMRAKIGALDEVEHGEKKREWMALVAEEEEWLGTLTLADWPSVLRPDKGSVGWRYDKMNHDIWDLLDPRVPIEKCRTGVLYKIHCRNSNCGIWRPEERGFEIARTKFDSTYLFVEYHWDTGQPFGTARPYEVLDELPDFADDGEKLRYLQVWSKKLKEWAAEMKRPAEVME